MITDMAGFNDFKAEGVCIIGAFASDPVSNDIAPRYESISKDLIGRVKFGKFDLK
jgi:hypothetical protein